VLSLTGIVGAIGVTGGSNAHNSLFAGVFVLMLLPNRGAHDRLDHARKVSREIRTIRGDVLVRGSRAGRMGAVSQNWRTSQLCFDCDCLFHRMGGALVRNGATISAAGTSSTSGAASCAFGRTQK
jgi:hypothetical protein